LYLGKEGIPAYLPWARILLGRGCKLGDEESCHEYLRNKLAEVKNPNDDPRGSEKACTAGDGAACVMAGYAFARGTGVERDPRRSEALLRKACEAGHAAGCGGLGLARKDGVLMQRACSGGFSTACGWAAAQIHEGYGRDHAEEAAALNELGCASGDGDSCIGLAKQIRLGDGVPRNEAESLKILEAACRIGNAKACGERGMAQTDDHSREYFQLGCDAGDAGSCNGLALTYSLVDPRRTRLLLTICRDMRDLGACVSGKMTCEAAGLSSPDCRELNALVQDWMVDGAGRRARP
jgi:TPR repeat protein